MIRWWWSPSLCDPCHDGFQKICSRDQAWRDQILMYIRYSPNFELLVAEIVRDHFNRGIGRNTVVGMCAASLLWDQLDVECSGFGVCYDGSVWSVTIRECLYTAIGGLRVAYYLPVTCGENMCSRELVNEQWAVSTHKAITFNVQTVYAVRIFSAKHCSINIVNVDENICTLQPSILMSYCAFDLPYQWFVI